MQSGERQITQSSVWLKSKALEATDLGKATTSLGKAARYIRWAALPKPGVSLSLSGHDSQSL